jgi:hypothetical protein
MLAELDVLHKLCNFAIASYDNLRKFLKEPPLNNALIYIPGNKSQEARWFFIDNGNRQVIQIRGNFQDSVIKINNQDFVVKNAANTGLINDKVRKLVGERIDQYQCDVSVRQFSSEEINKVAWYVSSIYKALCGNMKSANAFCDSDVGDTQPIDSREKLSDAEDRYHIGMALLKVIFGHNPSVEELLLNSQYMEMSIKRKYPLLDSAIAHKITLVIMGLTKKRPEERMALADARELWSEAQASWKKQKHSLYLAQESRSNPTMFGVPSSASQQDRTQNLAKTNSDEEEGAKPIGGKKRSFRRIPKSRVEPSSPPSLWQRFKQGDVKGVVKDIYQRWKALPLGYKIAIGAALVLGVAAIVAGIVLVPEVTVPVIGASGLSFIAVSAGGGLVATAGAMAVVGVACADVDDTEQRGVEEGKPQGKSSITPVEDRVSSYHEPLDCTKGKEKHHQEVPEELGSKPDPVVTAEEEKQSNASGILAS